MIAYGRDGFHLLDQVYSRSAPAWLRELPAVQVLRRVWIQQFYRHAEIDAGTTTGRQEVRRREAAPDGDGLPPGHLKIISPYDTDARYSIKRDTGWSGYKVHFTETCNAPARNGRPGRAAGGRPAGSAPRRPAESDHERGHNHRNRPGCGDDRHHPPATGGQGPAAGRAPGRLRLPLSRHRGPRRPAAVGLTLVSPLLLDHSAQARAGAGYDKAAFTFDFDTRTATCPQGVASSSWTDCTQRDTEAIVVSWAVSDCGSCLARALCTNGKRRHITLRSRDLHEALADARARQTTAEWKARYAARAGVAGTMRQTTHVTGIRHARYRGLPKTALEHVIAATAVNLIRLEAYWTGRPLDRTRASQLARLDFTTAP
jgi:Transposase DDE domain